jgi:hypothetical protein
MDIPHTKYVKSYFFLNGKVQLENANYILYSAILCLSFPSFFLQAHMSQAK